MIGTDVLEEIADRIIERFNPEKIILFGSYAHNEAIEQSDVDLLIVAKTDLPLRERFPIARRLLADYPASFDVIWKTPEEYCRCRNVVNHIVYFAEKYGKVLYEHDRTSKNQREQQTPPRGSRGP